MDSLRVPNELDNKSASQFLKLMQAPNPLSNWKFYWFNSIEVKQWRKLAPSICLEQEFFLACTHLVIA